MLCAEPSSRTEKSSAFRSGMGRPLESTATTSTTTSRVVTLSVGRLVAAEGDGDAAGAGCWACDAARLKVKSRIRIRIATRMVGSQEQIYILMLCECRADVSAG